MAPVVHGLETNYTGRVDFLYLNIAISRNDSAKRAFGFRSTPHFFLVEARGLVQQSMQGVVPGDSLRKGLDALLTRSPASEQR